MTTSWRLLGVCLLAAVPALAGNELWSVVQGIAPGALTAFAPGYYTVCESSTGP